MSTTRSIVRESLTIPVGTVHLNGDLCIPGEPKGLVVFVHGSGSSRFSPRNQYVAEVLNANGCGTLLFDLLTPQEEELDNVTRRLRFDIDLLSSRVLQATAWLQNYANTKGLNVGYFGASTGAAAALIAAAENPAGVQAVVSRGGRPDLAGAALYHVEAPTLLIVGSNDPQVLQLNKEAAKLLPCIKRIVVVPGASHLFEEPGTLEQAANVATNWFKQYLG